MGIKTDRIIRNLTDKSLDELKRIAEAVNAQYTALSGDPNRIVRITDTGIQRQVQTLIKAARSDERNLTWQEIGGTINDLFVTTDSLLTILFSITDLDGRAAIYKGDDLKREIPETRAGELMAALSSLALVADRVGGNIDVVSSKVHNYFRAIAQLHKNDGGHALRELAKDQNKFAEIIAEWRESRDKAGRPTGMSRGRFLLAERIQAMSDDLTAAQKVLAVKDELGILNKTTGKHEAKPGISDDEKAMLKVLEKVNSKNAPNFVNRLLADHTNESLRKIEKTKTVDD